jgi:hypothetical protein
MARLGPDIGLAAMAGTQARGELLVLRIDQAWVADRGARSRPAMTLFGLAQF